MLRGLRACAVSLGLVLSLGACANSTASVSPSFGQHTLACVNAALDTDADMPEIVVMKRSDFAQRFGAQYDGYYVGREQRIYLSSRGGGSLLAHELAHHARHTAGGYINEAEAEAAAMRCADGKGWRG